MGRLMNPINEAMFNKAKDDLKAGDIVITRLLAEWASDVHSVPVDDSAADAAFYKARKIVMEEGYSKNSPIYVTHPLPTKMADGTTEYVAQATTNPALILRSEAWMLKHAVTRLETIAYEQRFWLAHVKGTKAARGRLYSAITTGAAMAFTAAANFQDALVEVAEKNDVDIQPKTWTRVPRMGSAA